MPTLLLQRRVLLGRRPITPLDIPGLQIWLDAQQGVYSDTGTTLAVANDPVRQWNDQSGHGIHAGQATLAKRPRLKDEAVNGLRAIRFDGADDAMALALSVASGSLTIIAAIYGPPTGASGRYLMDAETGRLIIAPRTFAGTSDPQAGWYDGSWHQMAAGTTGWQVLVWVLPSGGTGEVFRNGVSIGTAAYTAKAIGGGVHLGARYNGGDSFFSGDMHAFLVYNRALTAAEWGALSQGLRSRLVIQSNPILDPAGVWSWFTAPRMLRVGNLTLAGVMGTDGSHRVLTYNHDTGAWAAPSVVSGSTTVDDHNNPPLLQRASDGKIMIWFSQHQGPSMYMRVSTTAGQGATYAAEVEITSQLGLTNYSYANPVQLTGEANSPIYLFFRGKSGADPLRQHYSKSIDDGVTWATALPWLANAGPGNGPYVHVLRNGTARIDFAFTDLHPNDGDSSIYHGYYQGGQWFKTDGTLVGAVGDLPFDAADFTLVYDGTGVGGQAWIHCLTLDGTGKPVIAYAAFPTTTDHRYRYARWDGAAWQDHQICTAGSYLYAAEAYYSGGVTIDPADPNVIYASRDSGDGFHQMWRGVTADGGANWTMTQLTNDPERSIRPVVTIGAAGEPRLAYCHGRYTTYTSYEMAIVLRDG